LLQHLLVLLGSDELLGLLVEILDCVIGLLRLLVEVTVELSVLNAELVDSLVLLLEVRLESLLLLLGVTVVALLVILSCLKLFVLVLELFNLLLLFEKIALDPDDLFAKVTLIEVKSVNDLILLNDFVLKLGTFLHHLGNAVVFTNVQTGALVNNLREVRDLIFEVTDDLSSLLFIVLGLFHELPGLIDLLTKNSNSLRVLLGQLDGSLNSCCVLKNGLIEIFASFDKTLL
jgi:hypothetical protein